MATITITGPILVCDAADDEPITDVKRLMVCDGVEEKDANLAEYLDGDLAHVGLGGGDLKLRFDAEQQCVVVVSTFESPRRLTPQEVEELIEYTRGQWSDGAGEGAFYDLMAEQNFGMDLTPSDSDKMTRAEQTDAGGVGLKPTAPLIVAVEKGDFAKVEKLLAEGADVNTRGKFGQTALHEAIMCDHVELAALLIERGADVNAVNKEGAEPLAAAAMRCDLKSAATLVKAGADVNHADNDGVTPLMWAANRGSTEIVKLLLDSGADPNAQDRVQHNEGRTALTYVRPESLDVADLILASGADPKLRDAAGRDAIEFALHQAELFERFRDNPQAAKHRKYADHLRQRQG
jgi:hypothetical protein